MGGRLLRDVYFIKRQSLIVISCQRCLFDLPRLEDNESKETQVVLAVNLVGNSAKGTRRGGPILPCGVQVCK